MVKHNDIHERAAQGGRGGRRAAQGERESASGYGGDSDVRGYDYERPPERVWDEQEYDSPGRSGDEAEPGYLRNAYRGRGSRPGHPGQYARHPWGPRSELEGHGYDWNDDSRAPWAIDEDRYPLGPGGYRQSRLAGRWRYGPSDPQDYRGLASGDRGYGLPGGGYGSDPLVDREHAIGQERQDRYNDFRGRGPKGYQRTDERIHEDVCEALSRDPYVDASAMEVRVKGGIVTLEGEAPSRRVKHRAENCADACSGVKDVENHLKVRRGEEVYGGSGRLEQDRPGASDRVSGQASERR